MLPLILPWIKEKDCEEYYFFHYTSIVSYDLSIPNDLLWIKIVIKKEYGEYCYYEYDHNGRSMKIDHIFKHFLCAEFLAYERVREFKKHCEYAVAFLEKNIAGPYVFDGERWKHLKDHATR